MMPRIFRWVDEFANLDVLIIGEAMLDQYLIGTTNRLCPEAPVPVVAVAQPTLAPGGAANSAVNVTALGARAKFLSVIGDDHEGALVRHALHARNVATDFLILQLGRRTLSKNRVVAGDHMLVRFDQGDTEAINAESERALLARLPELFDASDAIIVSDYMYGILTPGVIQALAELQAHSPRILVIDSKDLQRYRAVGATMVKPNYPEAVRLLEIPMVQATADRAAQMQRYSTQLLEATGAKIVAVTLDTDGALVFEQGKAIYRTYAQPMTNTRAAGAGDTFISTFALTLAAGAETPVAAELASAAAALVVQKEGTATCTAQELRGYLVSDNKYVADLARLIARVEFYREQGKQIVFTNGCFDILHSGHINYLNRAKQLGDILIVGVNTDASVRRRKGPERPINTLAERLQVLAALSSIDHLIAFDDDTPVNLVRALRPDVFVKGGDYTRATLPEAEIVEAQGGRVEILPYLPGHSTTHLIQRIRKQTSPTEHAGNGNGKSPETLSQPRPVFTKRNGKTTRFVTMGK